VSGATGRLAQLENSLAAVEHDMEERQADFDGTRPMQRMREALAKLKEELAGMTVRAGVAHAQLLSVQKRVADEVTGRRR
jgi:uncharacterized protein involved in exopolysaccharide biosynthesis